jgi:beta-glucosidase
VPCSVRLRDLRGDIDVGRASAYGVGVRGDMAPTSFMGHFEWAEGDDKRFGPVDVDDRTQARVPEASARWYADLIAAHREAHA